MNENKKIIFPANASREKPMSAAVPAIDEKCIDYSGYPQGSPLPERVDWLKANGYRICDEHLESVPYDQHIINNRSEITAVSPTELTRSVVDIKTDIEGLSHYEKWLTFDVDIDRNPTNVKVVSNFRVWPSCYSIPLIKSIIKKDKPDVLKFKYATVSGVGTIIIESVANGQPVEFFDFSNEPRLSPLTPDEVAPF